MHRRSNGTSDKQLSGEPYLRVKCQAAAVKFSWASNLFRLERDPGRIYMRLAHLK